MSPTPDTAGPLRVAFFVNRFPVLSEPFIANAALGLIEAGHSVDIYALQGQAEPDSAAAGLTKAANVAAGTGAGARAVAGTGTGMLAGCAWFPRHPRAFHRRLAAAPQALAGSLARHGLRALRTLDPRHYGRRAFSLRALAEVESFRPGAYDVLHCHFGTLAAPVLRHRRAGLLAGRVVVHFRGYDITEVVARAGPDLYADTFREADGFVANCRHFADRAVALGCDPRRITVVPSPVMLDRFGFAPPVPPADGAPVLLTVGRLVEKKGIEYVIEAVAMLRGQGRAIVLRIVGDGPLRAALEARAQALGIADAVRFLGAQPHPAIARELAASHLFAAPSVRAADGSEDAAINTLKEAMATGLPVVSTWHGGIPELVEHGVSGLLVPERDAAALAAALASLIDAPQRWAAMGLAGRQRIEHEHASAVANRRLLDVYRRVLADAPTQQEKPR